MRNRILRHPAARVTATTRLTAPPSRGLLSNTGVLEARLNWGILGVLATYQHTLSGVGSELLTVQPILYYNFQQGWYFRSDAIMQFNTYSHTNVVPVGLGIGKVVQLEGGYVLNGYVEVQPSVFRSGRGAPDLQIETGIQIQFPTSLTSGWKF
jgi:hypothetical protein